MLSAHGKCGDSGKKKDWKRRREKVGRRLEGLDSAVMATACFVQ